MFTPWCRAASSSRRTRRACHPTGSHVAYSVWRKGGYRDIRLVDVADGPYVEITHDRAIDGDPSFSKDGRWLLFHSDRTGVTNIYAYELATGVLKQVTNVINGAFQPELSPDGKTLLYNGYTHAGWDIYAMPFDPARVPRRASVRGRSPGAAAPAGASRLGVKPYNPLHTRCPAHSRVAGCRETSGSSRRSRSSGGDIAGLHSYSITYSDELQRPDLRGASRTLQPLTGDLSIAAYRAIAPERGLVVGTYNPTTIVEQIGAADRRLVFAPARLRLADLLALVQLHAASART